MVHSDALYWGDLIQLADPDTLSNPAKQEIKMEKHLTSHEVRLGYASNFKTIVTIRKRPAPEETIELKFDTVFAGAKDPQARQTKAQFFLAQKDLMNFQLALSALIGHVHE